MADPPTISVLIRTFNSGKTLSEVLSSLDLGDSDECIVVDSGSTDSTLAIAASHNAKLIRVDPPFNYSRSLNAGFEAAHGDWVLVLSSHCIPLRPDLLARMRQVATTADEAVAVVYGRVSLYDPGPVEPRVTTGNRDDWMARRFDAGGNGFAMYPKTFWNQHHFDESLITAEDLDWLAWALQSGYRASVVADAVVLYRNQGNMTYMFRKGWNETFLARSIRGETVIKRALPKVFKSFFLNCIFLTKLLVSGRFGLAAYLRMLAHGLGANLAWLANPKPETIHTPSKGGDQ